ncbi:MAG: hypothetical protein ACLPX1_01435 [Steroidobacteraceae bacterium]
MKRSSVALIGCFALLMVPVAALASSPHAASRGAGGQPAGATATHGPIECKNCSDAHSTIGLKYNGLNSGTPFSTLIRGELIAANCPTDRQCLLLQLRNQGLALKEKDGGKLTAEHRAQLQAQLDLINARYH